MIAAVAAGQGAGFPTRSYVAEHVRSGQVTATELDAPDLHARFELIAATIDHLPFASRRIADALRQTTIPSTAPTIGEPPKNRAAVSS